MKIIIISPLAESLYNFRGELIKQFISQGHDVLAVSPPADEKIIKAVEKLGCRYVQIPLSRKSLNPLKELVYFFKLFNVLKAERPDKILAYTIKPVIWAGLSSRLIRSVEFYALIEGMGYVFHAQGLKPRLLRFITHILYRLSLKRSETVIFLNEDDRSYMIDNHLVEKAKTERLMGIGVNISHFNQSDVRVKQPVFLLMARLIVEKGHRVFYEAAREIKKIYPDCSFQILGQADEFASNAISVDELQRWVDEGVVEYLGEVMDVRPILENCSVFVLPSFYGEGLPRSILEAMAIGRPIITTDNVGCRDTVEHQSNGLLIEKNSTKGLFDALQWMLENTEQWQVMGQKSREMIEQQFDVRIINEQFCVIMGLPSS